MQSPLSSSPPPMSPTTSPDEHDRAPPRQFYRRESLSVAGARRSTLYPGSVTSPRAIRGRPSVGSSSQMSSSHSGGSQQAHSGGPFGVAFRNAFGSSVRDRDHLHPSMSGMYSPTHEEAIEGSAISTGGNTPLSERPAMPKRRRSSMNAPHYHWLSGQNANTGDEPGVDVRSARDEEAYSHLTGHTHITVVDYSSDPDADDTNVRIDFEGGRLGGWLDSEAGKRPMQDGKPLGVRWMHVTGLNWQVIKTLTLRYQLHPLAVEDALRSGRSPRSKVDYYRNHLYLQILTHHVHQPDRDALARAAAGMSEGETVHCKDAGSVHEDIEAVNPRPRWRWWKRPQGEIRLPEGVDTVFAPTLPAQERGKKKKDENEPLPFENGPDDKTTHRLVIDQLSASYMVPIRKGIISIFMMRDGTLITICAYDIKEALEPIYERLEDEHSLLRRSGDVSMLAHALIDVTVDLDVEIAQAFEAEILKAESRVLVQAQMEFVRHLFIIQAQITRFRRQLTPLLYACYIIRDQDTTRAGAAGALTLPRAARAGSNASMAFSTLAGAPAATGTSASRNAADSASGGIHGPGTGHLGGIYAFNPGFGGVGSGMGGLGSGAPTGVTGGVPGSGVADFTLPASGSGVGGLGAGGAIPGATPEGVPWSPHDGRAQTPVNGAGTPASRAQTPTPGGISASAPAAVPSPVAHPQAQVGYFSPLTKVYMNDVIDHLEMVVGSCEQFVSTCDHLTDYTFNTLSFQTNNSMERLSIVTVIFLRKLSCKKNLTAALTFISSYFGMNFIDFSALDNNVAYFWKVAAPCTIAFFVIFSFSYLQSAGEIFFRRMQRWRREREVVGRGRRVSLVKM